MHALSKVILSGIVVASFCRCAMEAPTAEETPAPDPAPAEVAEASKPTRAEPDPAAIVEVDITEVFALREAGQALIYDVRLPLYYKLGHIEGAILFYPKPFDEAFAAEEARMKQAVKDGKTIVLYCGGADCNDSHIVGKMIAAKGIPVSIYAGGWAEWKAVGMD
ncbi:MAG: rhodanese-like domain-containing protein [Verrucomicrobiota bacterium]